MYSPFYTAHLNRLYPNRKHFINPTVKEVAEHFKTLIKESKVTLQQLSKTTLGEIKRQLVINASSQMIMDAISLIKTEQNGK